MRFLRAIVLTLSLVGGAFAQAPSPTDAALQRLRADRDRAIATVTEPVERRYRVALEQLLRATMQRGDLDGAIQIKKVLSGADPSVASSPVAAKPSTAALTPTAGTVVIATKRFAGIKWQRSNVKIEFDPDGTFHDRSPQARFREGKWVTTSNSSVLVTFPDGSQDEFNYTHDGAINRKSDRLIFPPVDPAAGESPNAEPAGVFGQSRP